MADRYDVNEVESLARQLRGVVVTPGQSFRANGWFFERRDRGWAATNDDNPLEHGIASTPVRAKAVAMIPQLKRLDL